MDGNGSGARFRFPRRSRMRREPRAGGPCTYLAVRGADDVLDRVRSCWASLYNDESVSYRRRQGIGELDLETPRFRLTLRRTPAGWTQSTQVLSAPQ